MGHEINITKKLLAFLIKLADTLVCKVCQEFLSHLEIYQIRREKNHIFGIFWIILLEISIYLKFIDD